MRTHRLDVHAALILRRPGRYRMLGKGLKAGHTHTHTPPDPRTTATIPVVDIYGAFLPGPGTHLAWNMPKHIVFTIFKSGVLRTKTRISDSQGVSNGNSGSRRRPSSQTAGPLEFATALNTSMMCKSWSFFHTEMPHLYFCV